MANREWPIVDGKADALRCPMIPPFHRSVDGPTSAAAGERIVQNKANWRRGG